MATILKIMNNAGDLDTPKRPCGRFKITEVGSQMSEFQGVACGDIF